MSDKVNNCKRESGQSLGISHDYELSGQSLKLSRGKAPKPAWWGLLSPAVTTLTQALSVGLTPSVVSVPWSRPYYDRKRASGSTYFMVQSEAGHPRQCDFSRLSLVTSGRLCTGSGRHPWHPSLASARNRPSHSCERSPIRSLLGPLEIEEPRKRRCCRQSRPETYLLKPGHRKV